MIKPFADDETSSSVGGLTVENGTARVVISGSVEIGRDPAGLAQARELQRLMNDLVAELEAGGAPQRLAAARPAVVDEVDNPFA